MKRKIKQKNNNVDTFTFDEYLHNFFPKAATNEIQELEEPSELGISLARTSLSKLQKILALSSK